MVASLVLHYLEDWGPTLAEMRRVLRPGGRLIASVQHPAVISEPQVDPAAREPFPDDYRDFSNKLSFLCFVVEVPPPVVGASDG